LVFDPSIDQNFGARVETKEKAKPPITKFITEPMLILIAKRIPLAIPRVGGICWDAFERDFSDSC
jgi:hypothetical protein